MSATPPSANLAQAGFEQACLLWALYAHDADKYRALWSCLDNGEFISYHQSIDPIGFEEMPTWGVWRQDDKLIVTITGMEYLIEIFWAVWGWETTALLPLVQRVNPYVTAAATDAIDLIDGLLGRLTIRQLWLGGHSFGGMISQYVGSSFKARFPGLRVEVLALGPAKWHNRWTTPEAVDYRAIIGHDGDPIPPMPPEVLYLPTRGLLQEILRYVRHINPSYVQDEKTFRLTDDGALIEVNPDFFANPDPESIYNFVGKLSDHAMSAYRPRLEVAAGTSTRNTCLNNVLGGLMPLPVVPGRIEQVPRGVIVLRDPRGQNQPINDTRDPPAFKPVLSPVPPWPPKPLPDP